MHYQDIVICESNLDWMGDSSEAKLKNPDDRCIEMENEDEIEIKDFGPSKDQCSHAQEIQCLGMINDDPIVQPQSKGLKILNEISKSLNVGNSRKKMKRFDLPYSKAEPINEF